MKRPIRDEEKRLLLFLLQQAKLNPHDYALAEKVDDYEGGIMGSIGMGKEEAVYDGDLIQVEYVDEDGIQVIITLTKDTQQRLLDLDFWKVDFSKLVKYPTPEKVVIKSNSLS